MQIDEIRLLRMAYQRQPLRMLLEVGDKNAREKIAKIYKDCKCDAGKTALRVGVSVGTFHRWKKTYPKLKTAIDEAKRAYAKSTLGDIS